MLELKNIIKCYTTGEFTQTALNGISIKFRKNEFVAILGPSGSGKTTCLNVIGGLDQYDEGDVIINGTSTRKFTSSDWDAYRNNSIGFIFQSYNLIPHLDLIDNVTMGMTLSGVSIKEKNERAIDYTRTTKINLLQVKNGLATSVNTSAIHFTAFPTSLGSEKTSYLTDNYDLLCGSFPTKKNDLLLVVDSENKVDVGILEALGFDYKKESIPFDTIVGTELKAVLNNEYYKQTDHIFTVNGSPDNLTAMYESDQSIPLKIVGIIRGKE